MFGDGLSDFHGNEATDEAAAMATFHSLLARLQRAADAGRLVIDDVQLAGQVVWAMVHGHMTIELTGYFESTETDPAAVYAECLLRIGLAFGADQQSLRASLATGDVRRRAVSRR